MSVVRGDQIDNLIFPVHGKRVNEATLRDNRNECGTEFACWQQEEYAICHMANGESMGNDNNAIYKSKFITYI